MARQKSSIPKKGLGHLYKRAPGGKIVPITSKIPGCVFILDHRVDNKRYREVLRNPETGEPVLTLEEAQQRQREIRMPFLSQNDTVIAEAQLNRLAKAKIRQQAAVARREEEKNPPLKIEDAWNAYVAAPNRHRPAEVTMQNYHSHWGAFTAWMAKQDRKFVYLRDVTEDDAGKFLNDCITVENLSNNTFNKYLQFLRYMFKVLAKPAKITSNPFDNIERRALNQHSHRELTIEELTKVINTATGDLRLLFMVGIFTGLRLGDCVTLKWSEIDLVERIIKRIPRKTATRSRKTVQIGIPAPLFNELCAIPAEQHTGYLFPEYAEMHRPGMTKITDMIQKHFKNCGLQLYAEGTGAVYKYEGNKKINVGCRAVVEVGFHSLRHTWVSIHARQGTPLAVIQDTAGHSNPAMTEHYTHINAESARQAAKALELSELRQLSNSNVIDVTPVTTIADQIAAAVTTLTEEQQQKVLEFIQKKLD